MPLKMDAASFLKFGVPATLLSGMVGLTSCRQHPVKKCCQMNHWHCPCAYLAKILANCSGLALTGQESKRFNPAEELKVKTVLQRFAFQDQRNGYIGSDEARQIIGLSNTQSEIVQLSNLFKKWSELKEIEMVKRGHWRFISETERNTRVIMSLLAKKLNVKSD